MFSSHTPGEVRQFDLFKLLVLLLLLAALIALLATLAVLAAPAPTPTPTVVVVTVTPSVVTAIPSVTPSPTPTVAGPTVTPTPAPAAGPTVAPTSTVVPSTAALTLDLPRGKSDWPSGSITLPGAGPAGQSIEVLDGGAVIGAATVGADGKWSLDYRPKNGDHDFSVRLAGATEATAPVAATVINLTLRNGDPGKQLCVGARGQDLGDVFIVARCDVLSIIATRTHLPLADLLAANPQITDPNIVYPGQVVVLPRK